VYNRLHNLERRAEHDPEFVIPDLSGEEVDQEIVDLEPRSNQG
jgi:hypothetical protein